MCEEITGNKMVWKYEEKDRGEDHIWRVSYCSRFKKDYPEWKHQIGIQKILEEIYQGLRNRL